MVEKTEALMNAIAATTFLVLIGGAAIAAADYLLVLAGEHLLEAASILPAGWAKGHQLHMIVATGVLAVPGVVWLAIWTFRRAMAGEREAMRGRTDG